MIDGQTVAEINSNQDSNAYSVSTAEYFVDDEYHLLDIVSQVSSDGAAMVGIDYVEIFQSPPVPYVEGNADVASDLVVDVLSYDLVHAPPTLLPSPSPPIPSLVTVDVVVAYDLNVNDVADPNEGVRGISVRVVDAQTNNLLASAVSDDSGFVRIQVVSERDVRLVIPLLGETELVRVRREQGVTTSWNILVAPATLPGLIP